MSLIQYYESSLSKRFYYSKILYLNTIIMALASFYIFASTTTLAMPKMLLIQQK